MKKNINLKNILFIIVTFIILNAVYVGQIYRDVVNGRFGADVAVSVEWDGGAKQTVKLDKLTFDKKIIALTPSKTDRNYFTADNGYIRDLVLTIDKGQIDSLKRITVIFDNRQITVNKEELRVSDNTGSDEQRFSLPERVYYNKSVFLSYKGVINLRSDFENFISGYIAVICFFVLILFFYLYRSDKQLRGSLSGRGNDYVYAGLFTLIVVLASVFRFCGGNLPFVGGDSWGYFGPAIGYFDTGSFVHYNGRSFPYPLFILTILNSFNDFSYITIVQHLTGILSGIMVVLLLNGFAERALSDKKHIVMFKYLNLFFMFIFLLNESPVALESLIRSESIFAFLLAIFIIDYVFMIVSFFKRQNIRFTVSSLIFIMLNFFMFVYQPRWGLNIVINSVIFTILAAACSLKTVRRVGLIAAGFILAFMVSFFPDRAVMKNESSTDSFLSSQIFWTHSKIISKVMLKDIENPDFVRYDKAVLKKITGYMEIEFSKPQRKHKYLGFRANSLIYGPANRYMESEFSTLKEYNRFTRSYFMRGVLNYPLDYAGKVLLELSQFYNLSGDVYPKMLLKSSDEELATAYSIMLKKKTNYRPMKDYVDSLGAVSGGNYSFRPLDIPFYDGVIMVLSLTYLPMLIAFMVFFARDIYCYFRFRERSVVCGMVILGLLSFSFFINLTNAAIYCLDLARYKDDQFMIVTVSHALMALYLFNRVAKGTSNNPIQF